METSATDDSDAVVLTRARGLVEYLLAVRAVLERPARTVPLVDAFWEHDLPDHPAVVVGPDGDAEPWLRVGRPGRPADPIIPAGLANDLVWDLSYEDVPHLTASPPSTETLVAFDAWIDEVWRPWATAAAAAAATRKLHDRLYDLRFRLDNDAARAELVWGHVILDAHVRRPARPVPADRHAGRHRIRPGHNNGVGRAAGTRARLQPDALADIDSRRVADLLDLGGAGDQVDVDPWDEPGARGASPTGRYAASASIRSCGHPWMGHRPVHTWSTPVCCSPVPASAWSAGSLSRCATVSTTGRTGWRARQRSGARAEPAAAGRGRRSAWAGLADRLLMPMATNEAQESIVRRLAEHRSVAVQGPPGTGKTHTIRNLICHLVAHGKRVLVLAQKEDPLRVLRGGLPEEIQPLCLAILGRSADQLVQLQIAARELSDRAATLDQAVETRWVDRLSAEIVQVEADLAVARTQLQSVAERERAPIRTTAAGVATASDVGVMAAVPQPPSSVSFRIRSSPTSTRRCHRRRSRRCSTSPAGSLPTIALPRSTTCRPTIRCRPARRSRRDGGACTTPSRSSTRCSTAVSTSTVFAGWVKYASPSCPGRCAPRSDELTRREGTWADRLGRLIGDPSWQPVWDDHVAACHRLMAELGQRTTLLAGRAVAIPDERAAEPRRLRAQLAEARTRLAVGRKISRLTQPELARLMTDCRVDGEVLRTVDDIDLVLATVERRQLRTQLALRWTEWSTRLDFPIPAAAEPEVWAGRLLTEAVDALDWDRHRWPALYRSLVEVYPRCARDVDVRTLAELAGAVEACGNVLLEDRLTAENRTIETTISGHAELIAAWRAGNDEAWDTALAEVTRLRALTSDALAFEHDTTALREAAPRWTASIERGEALPATGDIAIAAWEWRQAQTWFDDTVGTLDTAELGRVIERDGDHMRMLTRDALIASAWLHVARTLDDRKKAALADWTAALRKIGKGTGKSAGHWQAVAQRAMSEAVAAVPVWVMSVDRALEQFHGGGPIFDVVIVDEASQADIFALPVLSLARRAVVVGDDQQIGPQLVGVPGERVRGLIETHLSGVPSASTSTPKAAFTTTRCAARPSGSCSPSTSVPYPRSSRSPATTTTTGRSSRYVPTPRTASARRSTRSTSPRAARAAPELRRDQRRRGRGACQPGSRDRHRRRGTPVRPSAW